MHSIAQSIQCFDGIWRATQNENRRKENVADTATPARDFIPAQEIRVEAGFFQGELFVFATTKTPTHEVGGRLVAFR